MDRAYLQMKHIEKSFPGVHALKGVSLAVNAGEVHGLLGENGAGKSTLMKVLGGIYRQDAGEIVINGVDCTVMTPEQAQKMGVGFVHQELNLAEALSVAENLYMGRLPYKNQRLGIIDYPKLYSDTEKILRKLGAKVKATDIVNDLSTAQKQLLEIGKAISQQAKIIIFDEPTTALGNADVALLFGVIRSLKQERTAIIYISHRLKEIFEICDHATILRDGQYIGTVEVQAVSQNTLIRMMVGRDVNELFPKVVRQAGETCLEVEDLSDYGGKVRDVSFQVKRGEIVGFAGLVGSGRTELVRLLFGADAIRKGQLRINGQPVTIKEPRDAIGHGLCLLTEDRKRQGLSLLMSVAENITITNLENAILKQQKLKATAEKFVRNLRIKTSSLDAPAGILSGGNQQKVVLAKWLNTAAEIFIFDEPTKGIDVGAKAEIYGIMNQMVKENKAVIMISSELPELLGMADRIYVMCEGRLTGEFSRDEATQEKIITVATLGGQQSESKAQ
ncbi:putative ribose/galactose/methyl galactoside import ATP-binding protein [Propionispora sp. 2/2-37]|uniref:sugar ABC transporter ATP-binding protein n=1 Tax=Propionispora sp. 2/2-37 TaxID=1677858 RepID=UPI0006BB6486|nr:sugar ABC transporter ATP-binding protein [Propionispora sp. 2/2-37]CUH94385.1 putative ribose/galactose/methyl galactoside import ATP-binding protein [Propionispora sp. 2/2-37]